MDKSKKTDISKLGEFKLAKRIAESAVIKQSSTVKSIGDDAAVLHYNDTETVVSTKLLLEGIHFDLIYTPLKHLGYKAVVAAISNIYAMNATPRQLMLSLGLSKRFFVEDVDELHTGIKTACEYYGVDLVGFETSSSMTGLTISITAIGDAPKEKIVYRSGGQKTDLLCLTGNLGAAYMGLQLLEREKRVFDGNSQVQPKLEGHDYILQHYLKPEARKDIVDTMAQQNIVPTAMIDVTNGLASDVLHLCGQSNCGVRIYLERIPISSETFKMAEEINIDAMTAVLNGGDDYELLFTVPVAMYETVRKELQNVDIIGHLCDATEGNYLITPDNQAIELTAQGWQ